MVRRLATLFGSTVVGLSLVLAVATPAAAATSAEKLTVMSNFTQPAVESYSAWYSARQNQSQWAEYGFDWSTDLCSSSPDQPLGFDFRLSCARHDWGYRNYKAMSEFAANKSRLDDAFYADLRRKCATYSSWSRPACYSLAWTYYQAVVAFGSLYVSADDINRAAELQSSGAR
jgi:Prokaryotic phospholipase A2